MSAKNCLDTILNIIRMLCPVKIVTPPPSRPISIQRPRGLSTEKMPEQEDRKNLEMHRSASAPNFATNSLRPNIGMPEQSFNVVWSETAVDTIVSSNANVTDLNDVTRLCSVALCNLARVAQFRAALVENNTGIVSLLVLWLNACGDHLKSRRDLGYQGNEYECHLCDDF